MVMLIMANNPSSTPPSNSTTNRLPHERNSSTIVFFRKPQDVIFGRDHQAISNEGNMLLRQDIVDVLEHYKRQKRSGKSRIIRDLIFGVLNRGGRFLKQTSTSDYGDAYLTVSYDVARKKVSASVRDACSEKVKCMVEMGHVAQELKKAKEEQQQSRAEEIMSATSFHFFAIEEEQKVQQDSKTPATDLHALLTTNRGTIQQGRRDPEAAMEESAWNFAGPSPHNTAGNSLLGTTSESLRAALGILRAQSNLSLQQGANSVEAENRSVIITKERNSSSTTILSDSELDAYNELPLEEIGEF